MPRFTADTYLYLVGFAALTVALGLVTAALRVVGQALLERRSARLVGAAVIVTVFALYASLTLPQVQRWEDPISLWAPTAEAYPHAPRPYRHVGWEYMRRGDYQKAREVLEGAYPTFAAARDIPAMLPEVLAKTGDPERAVEVSIEAIAENKKVEPIHHRVLLETLVGESVSLPGDEESVEATREAVEAYLDEEEWLAQENVDTGFAGYFLEQDRPELAVPFVELTFEADRPECVAWRLADRLPDEERAELDPPQRPSRCEF